MGSIRKHISLTLGVYVRYYNICVNILCSYGYHEIVSICLKLPVYCGIIVKTPVYVSFIAWATLPKTIWPVMQNYYFSVTSNDNNKSSYYYWGRGFDSYTLYRGWILVLVVIVCIDKYLIMHRITFVDNNIVLDIIALIIVSVTYLWRKHGWLSVYVCPIRAGSRSCSPYSFGAQWL